MTTDATKRVEQLSLSAVVRRRPSPDIEWVRVDGETVVYNGAHNSLHLLDGVGSAIWRLIDGHRNLLQMTSELAELFAQPAQEITDDVLAFASELLALGLVERC